MESEWFLFKANLSIFQLYHGYQWWVKLAYPYVQFRISVKLFRQNDDSSVQSEIKQNKMFIDILVIDYLYWASQYFPYIVAVSFTGVENQVVERNQPKVGVKFYHIKLYRER